MKNKEKPIKTMKQVFGKTLKSKAYKKELVKLKTKKTKACRSKKEAEEERVEGYPKGDSEHQDYGHGCCNHCGKDVGGHWSGGEGVCSGCNF